MRLSALWLLFAILVAGAAPAAGQGGIQVVVNGKPVSLVAPALERAGQIMVPAVRVFEAFGAAALWQPADRTISIGTRTGLTIRMRIGDPVAHVNGQPRPLPAPPGLISERPYVPANAVFAILGAWVRFDVATRTLHVASQIASMSLLRGGGAVRVVMDATGPLRAETMVLRDPHRLVVDLHGGAFRPSDQDIPVGEAGVARVRAAQFQIKPYVTRVVFDLRQEVESRVIESADSFALTIEVRPRGAGPAVQAPAPSPAAPAAVPGLPPGPPSASAPVPAPAPSPSPTPIPPAASAPVPVPSPSPAPTPAARPTPAPAAPGQPAATAPPTVPAPSPSPSPSPSPTPAPAPARPPAQPPLPPEPLLPFELYPEPHLPEEIPGYEAHNLYPAPPPAAVPSPGDDVPRITQVRVEMLGTRLRVVIEGTLPLGYSVHELPDPDRVVIDVAGAIFVPVKQEIPVASAVVSEVRAAQFQADPLITRIVIVLRRKATFTVAVANDTGSTLAVEIPEPSLRGHVVAIDAGHGGREPGAIGVTGLVEKDVVLDIALRAREMLVRSGVRVVMTREADVYVDLLDRTRMARRQGATVFVSIHANASTRPTSSGSETYYLTPQSQALAQMIQEELGRVPGLADRGIKTANFLVLRESDMPAVLVEVAYLSNRDEEARLRQSGFRQRLAEAIVRGVQRFVASYPVPAN
jgi:N-acetylmuramoyl-L-alanine amidase